MTKSRSGMHYILEEDGTIREVEDVIEWSKWFERANEDRIIAQTNIHAPGNLKEREAFVSTVFLGINHNFTGGPPVLFETLIEFTGDNSGDIADRYGTVEDAKIGHEIYVAAVRKVLESATEPCTLERVNELVLEESQPQKYGQQG